LIDIAKIPVVDFIEQTTVRLISSAYIKEPALAPLADNSDDLSILEDIEIQTSSRHNSFIALPLGVNPAELLSSFHGFGWTYVNAAFCYTRASGNRFNSANRGAWYACYGNNAVATSQAEVAYHLSIELDNVGIYDNITNYRELLAGFATRLHDLGNYTDKDFLHSDPLIAYAPGQTLAQNIQLEGGNGVLYPSARKPGGNCLAAFRPHIVQNIRHGATWQFKWDGTREPAVSIVSDLR
jgi:hypothetical protein